MGYRQQVGMQMTIPDMRCRGHRLIGLTFLLILAASLPLVAFAQDWPTKPIRYVIPFPPGGTQDVIARIIAPKLSETLGQPVVIENRPGASGVVGADIVAKARADGYVLLMTSLAPIAFAPALDKKPPYDPINDFVHVASLGLVQQVLVVGPQVKADSVAQLVALATGPAGSLNFGSSGNGSVSHLMLEKFRALTKANLRHVPYRGAAAALNDVISNVIPAAFDGLPSALPFIQANQVKVLAVAGNARSPALPNTPTLVELGYADMVVYSWFGIAMPAGAPVAVATKLNAAVEKALAGADVKKRFVELSVDFAPMSPAMMTDFVKNEIAAWRSLIVGAGLAQQ